MKHFIKHIWVLVDRDTNVNTQTHNIDYGTIENTNMVD